MKKLTFIVPSYKGSKFFRRNFENWKEIAKLVDVIIINDSLDDDSRKEANAIGAEYINKPNGNWGSVVNYAKNNKIIRTKYIAIVDSDDMLDIKNLKKLIDEIDNEDVYITNYIEEDFNSKKRRAISTKPAHKGFKFAFVHTLWFKTKLLKEMKELPEGLPHMDLLFTTYIMSAAKTHRYINCAPYIYFIGVEGQTASRVTTKTIKAYEHFLDIPKYIINKNVFGVYRDAFNHLEKLILVTNDKNKLRKSYELYKKLYKAEKYKNVFNRLIFIKLKRYLLRQYKKIIY